MSQIDIAFWRMARLESAELVSTEAVAPRDGELNAHEQEILTCELGGRTNVEIARIHAIGAFAAHKHVNRIIRKLGAADKAEAIDRYRRMTPIALRTAPGRSQRSEAVSEVALAAERISATQKPGAASAKQPHGVALEHMIRFTFCGCGWNDLEDL